MKLAQVDTEIKKLLQTLKGANATLLNYANRMIEELDIERQTLAKAVADMTAEAVSPEQIQRIDANLDNWDRISFEDRRFVADGLISRIQASSNNIHIE